MPKLNQSNVDHLCHDRTRGMQAIAEEAFAVVWQHQKQRAHTKLLVHEELG